MAENWFLKLDGIDGESTNEHHPSAIDVNEWSWGVQQSASPSVGGGGAGKASFQNLEVVTGISRASPHLIAACATGKHIKNAVLSGRRPATVSGESVPFFRITMTDVLISSVQYSDAEISPPIETVSLSYAKVEWSYYPQSVTGSTGTPVESGWDVTTSKPLKTKKPNKVDLGNKSGTSTKS